MEVSLTVRLTEEEIRHAIEDYLTVKGIRATTITFYGEEGRVNNRPDMIAEVKGEPIGSTDTTRNKINRG